MRDTSAGRRCSTRRDKMQYTWKAKAHGRGRALRSPRDRSRFNVVLLKIVFYKTFFFWEKSFTSLNDITLRHKERKEENPNYYKYQPKELIHSSKLVLFLVRTRCISKSSSFRKLARHPTIEGSSSFLKEQMEN